MYSIGPLFSAPPYNDCVYSSAMKELTEMLRIGRPRSKHRGRLD